MLEFYRRYIRPALEDDAILLSVIILTAFFLRLIFLNQLIYDPAFLHPVVDGKEHNYFAFELLDLTRWRMTHVWYHTPGYAYFVAIIYKVLGHSVLRLAVVQYLLGAVVTVFIFMIAKSLINRIAGIVAAVLCSFFWFFIYTQSHVFSENLSMFLNVSMIYFLVMSEETWRKYVLSGLLLGLSVVVRPEILPFAGLFLFWLIIRRLPKRELVRNYLVFLLGVCLIIGPFLINNYRLSGNFLIRQQIGINFYLGSLPQYKGSNIYVTIGRQWAEIVAMPYQELNIPADKSIGEKELNAFYAGKVTAFVREHPGEWISFMAGKIFSALIGIDFLRSEDVYFYDRYIRGTPIALVQTWHVCVLALLGIVLSARREAAKFSLLYLFLAAYALSMFFTYKTRYLISYLPIVLVFSAYAVEKVRGQLAGRHWPDVLRFAFVLLLLALGVRWNPLGIHWPNQSEMYYVIGQNFDFARDYEKALPYYERAIEMDPDNITAINDMGLLYMKTGDFDRAEEIFEAGLQRFPEERYFKMNYRTLQTFKEEGKPFSDRDIYAEEFLEIIRLYYHFFPDVYEGPVYQATKT